LTTRRLCASLLLLVPATGIAGAQEAKTTERPAAVRSAQTPESPVQEQLRRRIEAAPDRGSITVGSASLRADAALAVFYERRAYQPAWVTREGPRPLAEALLEELRAADQEGLQPGDYHSEQIGIGLRNARASTLQAEELVDLELLLTDAFLTYGAHVLRGRIDPETLATDWLASPRTSDLPEHLESALASGDVTSALASLLPPQPGYETLREALSRYRQIASEGGWPAVGEGPRLEPGDRDGRVPELRRRLAVTGDLPDDAAVADPADPELYDEPLADAVRSFQARHGLTTDAIVGPATLAALDTPVETRIEQIVLNLERWRWLPQELGERHVLVNAANFEVQAVEDGATVLRSRAIVGRPYRRTPVFSDSISYLVVNPYWNVPHSLAVLDQLPMQKQDPTYFQRVGMRVFRGWGADAEDVDPSTVDWNEVSARSFPYRLRQDPGPVNALGRIKFMFPNKFSVYLHDTPARDLYARSARDFSSGCIRVERSRELAVWLLGEGDRSADRLEAGWSVPVERTISLPSPVPIHLLYWTAWAEEDGTVHFRNDVYGRDERLAAALAEVPSTGTPGVPGSDPIPSSGVPR
jgi:murein L,D-transpeptidase YcbB/YkuD